MAVASLAQEKPNFEIYSLIWLDSSAGDSQDTIQGQQYLRTIINYIKLFKKSDECEEYIQSIPKNDRIFLVVSGRLGQEIVPHIHQLSQISSIYVYCMNKKKNEQWVRPFNKIKHIVVDINELVNKIREDYSEQQKNQVNQSISYDIFRTNSPNNEINNSFLFSHLLINCLIQTNSCLNDKMEFLSLCKKIYEGNEEELKILEEFQTNYIPSRALWWYTKQSFMYRLLNKALQIENIELLLYLTFFIRDIQRQLEITPYKSTTRVYYGQIMSNNEIDILKKNILNFMIINTFLLTTTREQIQTYFSQIKLTNDYQYVIFDIEAQSQLENRKPFSNIKTRSYYTNEDQTLFMLGSIFRLISVRHEHSGNWIIHMQLCSEKEQELKLINEQNQIKDSFSFGQEFCRLKKFDYAEKYYHYLLKNLSSDHEDIVLYYDGLANLEKGKGNYDLSIEYFNKSLEIKMNIYEIDHPNIADSYNNIGEIYLEINDFKRAFDSFNKAMIIYKKKLEDDHPKIAICFNNIGHIYKKDKKYSKALEFYQKALSIRQKRVSQDHPQLADSYKNVAIAYEYMNNLDQALENYNQSLKIGEKSLSPQHFIIGIILKSIGSIYENKEQFQQSRTYYEKAITSLNYVLSPTDHHILQIQQDLQRVTAKLK